MLRIALGHVKLWQNPDQEWGAESVALNLSTCC